MFANTYQSQNASLALVQTTDSTTATSFHLFNYTSNQFSPLNISELNKTSNQGLCRISNHLYFICGGTNKQSGSASRQAFLVHLTDLKSVALPLIPENCPRPEVVLYKSMIYLVDGCSMNEMACYSFCFESRSWAKLFTLPRQVSRVDRLFAIDDQLVMCLPSNKMISIDLNTLEWSPERTLPFAFKKCYMTAKANAILVGAETPCVCEFDFLGDKVRLIAAPENLGDFTKSFHLPENNCIYFYEPACVTFARFNITDKKFEYCLEKDVGAKFNSFIDIRGADNRALCIQDYCDAFNSSFVHYRGEDLFLDRTVIFGSHELPFHMSVSIAENGTSTRRVKTSYVPLQMVSVSVKAMSVWDKSRIVMAAKSGSQSDSGSLSLFTYDLGTAEFAEMEHSKLADCGSIKLMCRIDQSILRDSEHHKKEHAANSMWKIFKYLFRSRSGSSSSDGDSPSDLLVITESNQLLIWETEYNKWTSLGSLELESTVLLHDSSSLLLLNQNKKSDQNEFQLLKFNPKKDLFESVDFRSDLSNFHVAFSLRFNKSKHLLIGLNAEGCLTICEMKLQWNKGELKSASVAKVYATDDVRVSSMQTLKHTIMRTTLFIFYTDCSEKVKVFPFSLKAMDKENHTEMKNLAFEIEQEFDALQLKGASLSLEKFHLAYSNDWDGSEMESR